MKIAFQTLGCKLNFAETSAIANRFRLAGHEVVDRGGSFDAFVLNSCAVTDVAEKKSRSAVRQAKKRNPDAIIAVIGCYAQLSPGDIASMKEVDIITGNEHKYDLVDVLENFRREEKPLVNNTNILMVRRFMPGYSQYDRTRTFLKIQDGCNYRCSYCTVPLARGRSRSESAAAVVKQLADLDNQGVKEVVLTGVNIGDFGRPNGESLEMLLEMIVSLDLSCRIRIGSVEPDLLSDKIIDLVASSDILMPHFHLPLQAGSDKILKAMKRKYNTGLFADRIRYILSSVPDAFIACDIITGFPGESDNDFEDGYRFLESLTFSYLHIFPYSERPGTTAASMEPKVDALIKKERGKKLLILSEKRKKEFYKKFEGDIREVLFESERHKDMIQGFTDNYIRVMHPWQKSLVNCRVPVKLLRWDNSGMMIGQCDNYTVSNS